MATVIKFAAYGAKVSRLSNFLVLSAAIPYNGEEGMHLKYLEMG